MMRLTAIQIRYFIKGKYTSIDLTESGRKIAEQYYDGFIHISRSLNECLNLSLDIAETGALAILSKLDAETLRENPQGIVGGTPPLI